MLWIPGFLELFHDFLFLSTLLYANFRAMKDQYWRLPTYLSTLTALVPYGIFRELSPAIFSAPENITKHALYVFWPSIPR